MKERISAEKTVDLEDRLNNKFVWKLGMWKADFTLFPLTLSVCSRFY